MAAGKPPLILGILDFHFQCFVFNESSVDESAVNQIRQNMGKWASVVFQWRASDMVGQWGREGGRGELAGGQLQQTFAWDTKLVAWYGEVLNLQTCQIQWNWNLKKASVIDERIMWIFESCSLRHQLLGTTQPRAVPVAEPVFFRETRRLPPFSGKHFSISRPLLHY